LEGRQILRDISFSLDEGEALAIVGPNGAGKTVLCRALLGSVAYTGGLRWREGVGIGYVPQRFVIDKYIPLTVEEFFLLKGPGFWFPPSGFMRHVGHELSAGGLTRAILRQQLSELSGGQLQRVLISWAMVGHPDVLLFDEPMAGIDVGGEETIYDLVHRLRHERHTACILISHDLGMIEKHADRVLSINKDVIAYGAPKEALTSRGVRDRRR
jgi:zinc transport system ATP-binding protein